MQTTRSKILDSDIAGVQYLTAGGEGITGEARGYFLGVTEFSDGAFAEDRAGVERFGLAASAAKPVFLRAFLLAAMLAGDHFDRGWLMGRRQQGPFSMAVSATCGVVFVLMLLGCLLLGAVSYLANMDILEEVERRREAERAAENSVNVDESAP
jgi:hypothetical protein